MSTLELPDEMKPAPPVSGPTEKHWTALKHGIQHYGKVSDPYSATIEERGAVVELHKWYPGCGFHPYTVRYASIETAREAGKRWVDAFMAKIGGAL